MRAQGPPRLTDQWERRNQKPTWARLSSPTRRNARLITAIAGKAYPLRDDSGFHRNPLRTLSSIINASSRNMAALSSMVRSITRRRAFSFSLSSVSMGTGSGRKLRKYWAEP